MSPDPDALVYWNSPNADIGVLAPSGSALPSGSWVCPYSCFRYVICVRYFIFNRYHSLRCWCDIGYLDPSRARRVLWRFRSWSNGDYLIQSAISESNHSFIKSRRGLLLGPYLVVLWPEDLVGGIIPLNPSCRCLSDLQGLSFGFFVLRLRYVSSFW